MDYPVLTYAEAAPVIFLTGVVVSALLILFIIMLFFLVDEAITYFHKKNNQKCESEDKGD